MSEFQEVIKQFNRMCGKGIICADCDFNKVRIKHNEQGKSCLKFMREYPAEAEDTIMRWAKDHPEPVYPTWAEWLETLGLVTDVVDGRCGSFLYNTAAQPIPRRHRKKVWNCA